MMGDLTPISAQINGSHSLLAFWLLFLPPFASLHSHPQLFFLPLPSFDSTNPPQTSEATAPTSPETSSNMLLGKRPRPPMKRTTSLSEIPFDLNVAPDAPWNDPNHNPNAQPSPDVMLKQPGGSNWSDQSVSPTSHRRHSVDFFETAYFLRACFLCKRRLVPGRDIYMYRGDSAFCSLECRQQQMIQDERKEKRCIVSRKQVVVQPSESQVTTKGESVPAL